MRTVAAILFAVTMAAPGALARQTPPSLEAGLAEIEITPPLGYRMDGYFTERLSTGVKDPLKAKALVFRQGNTKIALVVCDLIGVPQSLTGDGAHRNSCRQHRDYGDAHSHRSALFRRTCACVQRTSGRQIRHRSARRGEVSGAAARSAR